MAQVIHMLQAGEFTLSGKDVCASADTIRWLQRLAVQMSQAYQASVAPPPAAPTPTDEPAPAGLPSGVTIKQFAPGKAGKAK